MYAKVTSTGHDALVVSGNDFTEISYEATARVSAADPEAEVATLVNVMANFQYWVKSDTMARGGDMGLEGWGASVYMGEITDESMPLEMGPEDTDEDGKGTFSYTVDPTMLPASFTVMAADDMGKEMYDQSAALVHTHTGLMHPAMNTMEMNDLGPIYITWTTQTLTVGVHREVDDEPGFTDFRAPMGGDARPDADVAKEMTVELLTRDSRNRLRTYDMWDHDRKDDTDPVDAEMVLGASGMASFGNLPANDEFTVRMYVGSDRVLVGETDGGDIDSFGDDLDIGKSYGSFGEMGGGMPEVKICSLTTDRSPAMHGCATFAYQWETGSVSGNVAGDGGASVSLSAETDNDDRGAKTSTKKGEVGDYEIKDIQDGTYTLTTPNTADNKFAPPDGYELEIYHDETKEDDDEDTDYVGTAWSKNDRDFTATKLRLSIQGFVANDENGDEQIRGDEAMAGVTVRLLQIAKDGVSDDKDDTTFVDVTTTETEGDGFYEFADLTEDDVFYVEVPPGDDYVGLHGKPGNNKSKEVTPDTYPDLVEGRDDHFPDWEIEDALAENLTPTVKNSDGSVSADLVNFALVYTNGAIGGWVNNLSGSDAGITIEITMCDPYNDEADPDEGEVECTWSKVYKTETDSRGDYEFDGLLEGWYEMWFTGGALKGAMEDEDGNPDDDGTVAPLESLTADLEGRSDYNGRNYFNVYSERADDDAELASFTVYGMDAAGDSIGHTDDLPQSGDNSVTLDVLGFDPGTATVAATTADDNASVSVAAFDGNDPDPITDENPAAERRKCSGGVCEIAFDPTADDDPGDTTIEITVTADNGYDDEVYALTGVNRGDPVGHAPSAVSVTGGGNINVGATMSTTLTSDAATAETAALHIDKLEAQDCKAQTIVKVTADGENVTGGDNAEDDCEGERFTVPLKTTRTTVVLITMRSEDGVESTYELTIQRS